jgi:hypothetical protein
VNSIIFRKEKSPKAAIPEIRAYPLDKSRIERQNSSTPIIGKKSAAASASCPLTARSPKI